MQKLSASLFLVFISLLSCDTEPCHWRWGYEHLEERPRQLSVAGTYVLTEESREFLEDMKLKNQYYKIELKRNGLYKITDFTEINSGADTADVSGTIVRKGKWSFSYSKSFGSTIVLKNVAILPVTSKLGRFAILIEIKDTKKCQGLVYERMGE